MKALQRIRVDGHVSTGFEAVRDVFAENFSRRHELGGACCVYHHGEKVVDLWGGVRNKSTCEPTLVTPLDAWPHSEMARFQRVLSFSLMILAAMSCAVEIALQDDARTQLAFGSGMLLSAFLAHREWRRVKTVRTALSG